MEKITALLDGLDLAKFVPQLDTLMERMQWLAVLAVRVGPICILVLGLIYLLIPPKEANRKAGYRTYFGMGSVTAWQFTQRVSGAIMTLMGLILTIIAFVSSSKFYDMDTVAMTEKAFGCIKAQIICTLSVIVFMFILTAVMFDRKGSYRFSINHDTFPGKLFPKEVPLPDNTLYEYEEEDYEEDSDSYEDAHQYEEPEKAPLTANDITIEDL